jgi:hypothetical protein
LLDASRERFILGDMPVPKSFVTAFVCFSFAQLAVVPADFAVPDNILFESGIEYANPDNQHLQLNIA